jgi:hypothetical protein
MPYISVDNKKKTWKMKIPLKTKIFAWCIRRWVILTKDNLVKHTWHESTKYVFCHHGETIKLLFFYCKFSRFIWSVIQLGYTLYPPRSVVTILRNWLKVVDERFNLLGWKWLSFFGRYNYIVMTRLLKIKK